VALKGTLSDFGLSDIFQLIGQQGKTGVLRLEHGESCVLLSFQDGSVAWAESNSRQPQHMVGSILVSAGVISPEQLSEALRVQVGSVKYLGQVLVDLQYVSQDDIVEFARIQMMDTVYRLFEWKTGTYDFEARAIAVPFAAIQPVRSDVVVMNAVRAIDEWPRIRKQIPSTRWLIQRVRYLAAAADASREEVPDDIGDYERRIYQRIAKGSTVQSVIDGSRLGEFEACRAIGMLIRHKYVNLVVPEEALWSESERRKRPESSIPRWSTAALVLFMTVLAAVASAAVTLAVLREPGDGPLVAGMSAVRDGAAERQVRRLRRIVAAYRVRTGMLPASLEDLVRVGLLEERELRYPFASPYAYVVEGDSFTILRPLE
jgi:hypothetical protein